MLRTFRTHQIRPVHDLNGHWDFEPGQPGRLNPPNAFREVMPVPQAWEMIPGYETHRGGGCYRRSFELPEPANVRVIFGGVSHTATVLVDGKKVAFHDDAYTPFIAFAPQLAAGRHEVLVFVRNDFGPHSSLHIENDYYTYGGITRPVEWEIVPDVFLERVEAIPVRIPGGDWQLRVRVFGFARRKTGGHKLEIACAGAHQISDVRFSRGSSLVHEQTLACPKATPWSPDFPLLHKLHLRLLDSSGQPIDDLIDRVGFREIQLRGPKILLNGEELRLQGYNRHEDHPQFGCALPTEAMAADLALLRDLGANFIRTSHYPNDMRFLDLCDELGFCVWEEAHARCVRFNHPAFRRQSETTTREMVEWHVNHPSIIIWGCLNECDSETARGRQHHARILAQLKKLDPSRPTTYASNKFEKDICLGLADIVSFNIYSGWYERAIEEIPGYLKGFLRWLDSDRSRGGRGKPLIVSEFGGAGIYGYRHPSQPKWSEEFQARLLGSCLDEYLHHPRICGVAIWQFSDIRVTQGYFTSRARSMNNKGTLDEYRRRKLSYEVVKEKFRADLTRFRN